MIYNHIWELNGAENYPQWQRQMTLALQGECLWPHCSNGSDPTNFINYASTIPQPADPKAITNDELERILDWLAKDAQMKALIDCKVSTVVTNLLSELQTARQQWELLAQHYSCNDILSQYELRIRVRSKKLKDAEDATHYVGVFEDTRRRFLQMGVKYTMEESIFDILQGLPDGVEWQIFRELTLNKLLISNSVTLSSTSSPLTSVSFTFKDAIKLLLDKANAIIRRRKLAGPGSEYANAAVGGRGEGKVNPTTGIRIHKNNPEGVKCTNECCVRKPHAETHDKRHCYWPGGGMEDKAPAWLHARMTRDKGETAAAVVPTVVPVPDLPISPTACK